MLSLVFRRWRRGFLASLGGVLLLGCNTTSLGPVTPGAQPGATSPSVSVGGGTAATGSPASPSVSASLLEQLTLERVNRARLRPAAEASNNNIAVDEGVPGQINTLPKQALALNAILNGTAKAHSQDMINQDYFAHDTPGGVTPFNRMSSAGYVFTAAGENLAWRGTTGTVNEVDTVEAEHVDLFVDAGISGRGHRVSMLNGDFREVGIGIVRGQFTSTGTVYDAVMQTQDFATASGSGTFVLGVIYNDLNGNGQYNYGEGVANTKVSLDTISKTTNPGGGYSFEVRTPGTYSLLFVSSNKSLQVTISQGSPNLKVDLVSGSSMVVNLGLGPL